MVEVGFEVDKFFVTSNTLSEAEVLRVKERFESLLSHLPSDSTARMTIDFSAEKSQWIADFSIRFAHGHIGHKLTDESLDALNDKMIAELGRKIGIWQAQRSIDLFKLNHTTEGTFFQQIEMNLTGPNKGSALKALVVEDDPSAVTVLQTLLENLGVTVTIEEKVSDALTRITSEHFDVIFLDWNLLSWMNI